MSQRGAAALMSVIAVAPPRSTMPVTWAPLLPIPIPRVSIVGSLGLSLVPVRGLPAGLLIGVWASCEDDGPLWRRWLCRPLRRALLLLEVRNVDLFVVFAPPDVALRVVLPRAHRVLTYESVQALLGLRDEVLF